MSLKRVVLVCAILVTACVAAGRTLLPGLIDAHVHLWDEAELAAYLAHGVTSIRNMSGLPFHLAVARDIDAGDLLGPDLVTTGPILNSPGPNQQDNHVLVTSAEEARAAVRRQHAQGYRTVKVYSNLYREAYEAILEESRRLGMALTGHTPEGASGAVVGAPRIVRSAAG
jgi:cytosine/adenosine deaminase-related metal-dependent hydrolase